MVYRFYHFHATSRLSIAELSLCLRRHEIIYFLRRHAIYDYATLRHTLLITPIFYAMMPPPRCRRRHCRIRYAARCLRCLRDGCRRCQLLLLRCRADTLMSRHTFAMMMLRRGCRRCCFARFRHAPPFSAIRFAATPFITPPPCRRRYRRAISLILPHTLRRYADTAAMPPLPLPYDAAPC